MNEDLIPCLMTIAMVVTNTFVMFLLNKRRRELDISVPENATQAKKLKSAVMMLYVQVPLVIACIWLILAPALAQQHSH